VKKAWSAFWLVILSVIALNIIFSLIGPWVPTIAIILSLAMIAVGSALIWRFIAKRRRFF
jgi:hypothetical protein